jgi:hypothetical protein
MKVKYKTIKETPFATTKNKFHFTNKTKIVSKEEFLTEDDLIPLLVCNQYRIYPDEFKNLKKLQGKTIALVGITYLSGCETNIEEYYLDDMTIFLLTFSSTNLIRGKYYDGKNYRPRLKNYWQHP